MMTQEEREDLFTRIVDDVLDERSKYDGGYERGLSMRIAEDLYRRKYGVKIDGDDFLMMLKFGRMILEDDFNPDHFIDMAGYKQLQIRYGAGAPPKEDR